MQDKFHYSHAFITHRVPSVVQWTKRNSSKFSSRGVKFTEQMYRQMHLRLLWINRRPNVLMFMHSGQEESEASVPTLTQLSTYNSDSRTAWNSLNSVGRPHQAAVWTLCSYNTCMTRTRVSGYFSKTEMKADAGKRRMEDGAAARADTVL